MSGLVYIAVGVVAVVALVLGMLVVVVVAVGGTVMGAAFRLVSVGVWTLTTAQVRRCVRPLPYAASACFPQPRHRPHPPSPQVISDVAAVASPSLPPLLRSLYSSVAVLQLQGALLPPACTGAYPFETQAITLSIANAAWLVAAVVYYATPRS